MGGTWLVRGAAGVVVAVLLGAWGIGVAGSGDPRPPTQERPSPTPPAGSEAPESERPLGGQEEADPPRARELDEFRDQIPEPKPSTAHEPTDDAPSAPAPTSLEPTPDPPASLDTPPPTRSDPPREPSDDCTDLLGAVDCVLNPITAQP